MDANLEQILADAEGRKQFHAFLQGADRKATIKAGGNVFVVDRASTPGAKKSWLRKVGELMEYQFHKATLNL